MIHAHHFYFADQPSLQKEYESFGFDKVGDNAKNYIEIKEITQHKGFNFRRFVTYLSGRECCYLSDISFEDIGKEDSWGLEVKHLLTLVWDNENHRILYSKGKLFTPELLRFWIFHTFVPIILEIKRKYNIFHVGSVEICGGPVLFSADSFGGKSTMTNYFIQKGHTLFSDDTLPVMKVGEGYTAYPSFPYHRPYRKVESLGIPAKRFARKPAPIKAIFELQRGAPDAAIEIRPANGVEKFKTLYYSHFIRFRFMKHERSSFALKMAKIVPVYNITVPWNLERIDEVYEAIVKQVSS